MESKMDYQLVIQLTGESANDFDLLIKLEDKLEEELTGSFEVDGHDFGNNEMNIFILTSEPDNIFKQIKGLLPKTFISNARIAYRNLESENYTLLWPKNLSEFIVS
jgi:hypothetical protein